jgi:hypothetical protein
LGTLSDRRSVSLSPCVYPAPYDGLFRESFSLTINSILKVHLTILIAMQRKPEAEIGILSTKNHLEPTYKQAVQDSLKDGL